MASRGHARPYEQRPCVTMQRTCATMQRPCEKRGGGVLSRSVVSGTRVPALQGERGCVLEQERRRRRGRRGWGRRQGAVVCEGRPGDASAVADVWWCHTCLPSAPSGLTQVLGVGALHFSNLDDVRGSVYMVQQAAGGADLAELVSRQ
eukprot:21673-Chlamydomonas_euryale.AAC.1